MANYDLSLQRKLEIENNLLELMQETPYDRIPVKALTDNLQIARKTFYHYFHNKQACLESLMDRMILESDLSQISLPDSAGLQDAYTNRLLFWTRNSAFLEAVRRNNLTPLFIERALLYIRREGSFHPSRHGTHLRDTDEDILYFYISGQICLLMKWCAEGFPRPLEEMAQISLRTSQERS